MAEADEEILTTYVENKAISVAQLVAALSRLTKTQAAIPVLLGSTLRGIGVGILLDYVISLLPANEGRIENPL